MSESERTVEDNKNAGSKIKTICVSCGRSNHKIIQDYTVKENDIIFESAYEQYQIYSVDDYQIIECQGCDNVSFRHLSWFSENFRDEDDDGTKEILYPHRDIYTLEKQSIAGVPKKIVKIYSETINCFNQGNWILCAGGVRAIVESICQHQGIFGEVKLDEGGNPKLNEKNPYNADGSPNYSRKFMSLENKITALSKLDTMTFQLADPLHTHRFLGNSALHELEAPKRSELKTAIEYIEHILKHLFELPLTARELKGEKLGNLEKLNLD